MLIVYSNWSLIDKLFTHDHLETATDQLNNNLHNLTLTTVNDDYFYVQLN